MYVRTYVHVPNKKARSVARSICKHGYAKNVFANIRVSYGKKEKKCNLRLLIHLEGEKEIN